MSDDLITAGVCAVICAVVAILAYDLGQRSKEDECKTFQQVAVRRGSHLPPSVYACTPEPPK